MHVFLLHKDHIYSCHAFLSIDSVGGVGWGGVHGGSWLGPHGRSWVVCLKPKSLRTVWCKGVPLQTRCYSCVCN